MNKVNHWLFLLIVFLGIILRFYRLSFNPPSLYWDEVSLGYNAFSLLNYGVDEHGESYPLARFIAFGDFKPPGYIYATVPSIWLFGVNELAVRFPSAVSGVFFIVITYLLTFEIFRKTKISLLASFLLAVSPWSLQISRAAFEAHLASFFNVLAIYFFLKLKKEKGWFLPLGVVFFILSFYTFNANRIIAPLLLSFLIIFKLQDLFLIKKWLFISLILGIVLVLPSISYLASRESKVRFQEVSVFNNLEILKKSNERISLHHNSLLSRLIHNRRIYYTKEVIKHFFDHFRIDFLFINGDKNPRLSSYSVGLLYLFSLPFLIIGILQAVKSYKKTVLFLTVWLTVSLLPASVSKETPHALRTASALPIYDLLVAYGIWNFFRLFSLNPARKFIVVLTVFILIGNFYYYLHQYYIHYPRNWYGEWQYGYKEAVLLVRKLQDNYDYVVMSNVLGRPYIYFLFYNQINPYHYLKTRIASRDWFGFWEVGGFDKYRFGMGKIKDLSGRILVVGTQEETKNLGNELDRVISPTGKTIFVITSLSL